MNIKIKRTLAICISLISIAVCTAQTTGCAADKSSSSSEKRELKVINEIKDLNHSAIGIQWCATTYEIANDVSDSWSIPYSTYMDMLRGLRVGEVDAIVIDGEVGKKIVADNPDKYKIIESNFETEEYAIAYSKEDENGLGKEVSEALEKLKEDGTIQSLREHWIGENATYIGYTPRPSVERTKTLRVATNAEFAPYEYEEEKQNRKTGNIIGFDIDIINAIGDEIGATVEIQNLPFEDVLPAVYTGKADIAIAGLTVTKERKANYNFTSTYETNQNILVVRNENYEKH